MNYCVMLLLLLSIIINTVNQSKQQANFKNISPKKNYYPPTVESLFLQNHAANNESDHISSEVDEYRVQKIDFQLQMIDIREALDGNQDGFNPATNPFLSNQTTINQSDCISIESNEYGFWKINFQLQMIDIGEAIKEIVNAISEREL